jgi:Rrf2 family protein
VTTAISHEAGAPPQTWRILSHSADYALRAVLYLAARDVDRLVPANEIAESLKVPQRYLGKVLNTLAHAGTLHSTRGPRGGFRLTRPASELTLAEVIAPFDAVGEPLQCLLHHRRCSEPEECAAHHEWQNVGVQMREFFNRMTVAGLLSTNGQGH